MDKVFDQVFSSIKKYIASVVNRNVEPTEEALKNLQVFEENLPEKSSAAEDVKLSVEAITRIANEVLNK